ncbi:MAG: response regulator transcription factor [Pseudomonadota bacterium]|nr:response regulator transcription factor [Pseudomonadota bacterium]
MRIAIADDDPELLEHLFAAIADTEHQCDRFRSGSELLIALKRETYDVVLVDWNMPGETGLNVIQWAVQTLEKPPAFILITSRSEKSDVVRGLEVGAVDYVVKPESKEVILARIEAANRRMRPPEADRFSRFGDYEIDRLLKQITWNGDAVKLTNKEVELATLFFDNLNRPLSRAYIFGQVWGGVADVESRTLDLHVSRVRSKLQLRPQHGFAIQTVFGFGYRMDKCSEPEDVS